MDAKFYGAEYIAYSIDEYHEDMGPVMWFQFPIEEPPYVGTPLDCGHPYKVSIVATDGTDECMTGTVGGWPGYHTHWIPLPKVVKP